MKYKYYGTAAAEAIPSLWCDCDVCERARRKGGRNIMSRSQQSIDDTILIDFSADTFYHTLLGLQLTKMHHCIITHDHEDHLYPKDIICRFAYFAKVKDEQPLHIYGMKPAIEHIKAEFAESNAVALTPERVKLHIIEPFKSFRVMDYKITPLEADHDKKSGCVIYVVEKDGKALLHANDTGYFPETTWKWLEENKVRFDFVSFDCTETMVEAENDRKNNHMNLATVKNVRHILAQNNLIDEDTVCVINHFSHNGKYIYDELAELVKDDDFVVSYDGLEIEF